MSWIKKFVSYYKDNPKGYWFKRKIYGWGWIPVKWQGWFVVAVGIAIILLSYWIGETDDAPGVILIGFLFGITFIFIFCYRKGEKPRWQWGFPEGKD